MTASRWRGKVPFSPTTTQEIRNALHESGRDDLVAALMQSGLKELEEALDAVRKRVIALEQERDEFVKESGVLRLLKIEVAKEAFDWSKWAIRGAIGVVGTSIILWLMHLVWIARSA